MLGDFVCVWVKLRKQKLKTQNVRRTSHTHTAHITHQDNAHNILQKKKERLKRKGFRKWELL